MATKIKGKYAKQFGAGRLGYFDPYSAHETVQVIAPVVLVDEFLGKAIDSTHPVKIRLFTLGYTAPVALWLTLARLNAMAIGVFFVVP